MNYIINSAFPIIFCKIYQSNIGAEISAYNCAQSMPRYLKNLLCSKYWVQIHNVYDKKPKTLRLSGFAKDKNLTKYCLISPNKKGHSNK